ncbi:MAG: glutamate 5-kinase [Firmicutes bacterium]|nr:glutamate 5-kinase [Bacillota bacterium]
MDNVRSKLQDVRRLTVKVGSSTLTYDSGKLNLDRIEHLVRELSDLVHSGCQVILVSSGAIAVGRSRLAIAHRPKTTPEKQALAAVGQGILMQTYEKFFAEYGLTVGQVLLTKADVDNGKRYENACNTFETLLNYGVIPIVNENDTVATEEIEFGDNDTLSAYVAKLAKSDLLVLLSDIEGLYTADPRQDPDARLIPLVQGITPEIEQLASGAGSDRGVGGMVTKIEAAKIAEEAGIPMIIINGEKPGMVKAVLAGENVGTLFLPTGCDLS